MARDCPKMAELPKHIKLQHARKHVNIANSFARSFKVMRFYLGHRFSNPQANEKKKNAIFLAVTPTLTFIPHFSPTAIPAWVRVLKFCVAPPFQARQPRHAAVVTLQHFLLRKMAAASASEDAPKMKAEKARQMYALLC